MIDTSHTTTRIVGVALVIVAALAWTLTACTSDGDTASPNVSDDRANTLPTTLAGPPVSIDPATPDDTVPPLPITLTVDGQTFTITERDGGHDYNWDTGPNPGYGFSESAPQTARISADDATKVRPPPPLPTGTLGHYRNSIRDFLSMIDPKTGYIEE
jgi:hypothetical protein